MNLLSALIGQCFINILSRVIIIVAYQIQMPGQPWIIFGICGLATRFLATCIIPAVDIIDGRTLDILWYKKVNHINHFINLTIEPLFMYLYMQIPCWITICNDKTSFLMTAYALLIVCTAIMAIGYSMMIKKKFAIQG